MFAHLCSFSRVCNCNRTDTIRFRSFYDYDDDVEVGDRDDDDEVVDHELDRSLQIVHL